MVISKANLEVNTKLMQVLESIQHNNIIRNLIGLYKRRFSKLNSTYNTLYRFFHIILNTSYLKENIIENVFHLLMEKKVGNFLVMLIKILLS